VLLAVEPKVHKPKGRRGIAIQLHYLNRNQLPSYGHFALNELSRQYRAAEHYK
jgi:hypothetical protein